MDIKNKPNLTRRKALIGGTAGVAAATAWHTPILNSVVLPAHAQTSTANFFSSTTLITQNSSPWDLLLPTANAGEGSGLGVEYTVAVSRVGEPGGLYEVGVHSRTSGIPMESQIYETIEVVYKGVVSLGATDTLDVDQNPCTVKLRSFEVEVEADNGDSLDIMLVGPGLSLNVPQGEGMLPDAACVFAIADSYFDENAQGMIPAQSSNTKSGFSPLDLFIEPAHALQVASHGLAAARNGTSFNIAFRSGGQDVLREGSVSAFGDNGTLLVTQNTCPQAFMGDGSITARINSVDATEMEIVLDLDVGSTTFTIPAAAIGSLPVSCDNT